MSISKHQHGTLLGSSMAVLAMIGALATAACSKGGGSACTPEHTTVADGGFCIKVPKAWEMKPAEKRGDRTEFTWFRKGEGGIFIVDLDPKGTMPADIESTIGKPTGSTGNVTKGEFDGGKGKWALSLTDKGNLTTVLVAGPKGLLHCGTSSDEKSVREMLALCQTLAPL